jgi:hypothetical protein
MPEDTRRSLGIKIAEVAEQKIVATVDLQLRVYEITSSAGLASGTVTPEQAKDLKRGETLSVSKNGALTLTGKITALNAQLQKATGMIEVLAEFQGSPAQLAVGDFLQGSAALESGESVVTVPRTALLQCSDGYSVYTVSGEHLVRTPVKVGAADAERVEIKDGLYAGDQVVLQPVMALWMTELASVKGGQSCCVAPSKGK